MSRSNLPQHYARLLSLWPTDRLRPELAHFQQLLRKRIAQPPPTTHDSKREINAAYLLIDNAFGKQYVLGDAMMKPRSNPGHYVDLERELAEAPDRTWWQGVVKRVRGMVRMR